MPLIAIDALTRPARGVAWLLPVLALPIAPVAFAGSHSHSTSYSYITDGDDRLSFAYGLVDPEHDQISGTTGSDDWRSLERLREHETGMVLWFRIDGRSYLVRDPAILARADEIMTPMRDIGGQQGRLGGRMGRMAGDIARLESQLDDHDGAGREELDRQRAEFGRQQEAIEREMSELSRQQDVLGRQQAELGRQQEALGRQQEKLAREANSQMRRLVDDALARQRATLLED